MPNYNASQRVADVGSGVPGINPAETPERDWKSMWPLHIRRSRCLLSRLDSEAPTQQPESASHPDRAARAAPGPQLRIRRKRRFQSVPRGVAPQRRVLQTEFEIGDLPRLAVADEPVVGIAAVVPFLDDAHVVVDALGILQ